MRTSDRPRRVQSAECRSDGAGPCGPHHTAAVYSCKYHVVWCPKYRRQVLVRGVEKRLKKLLKEVALERQAEVIGLEVMPDHVHVLVEVHPQFGVHRLVKARGA